MKPFSISFVFALLALLSASPGAFAGQYVYGISDDNKIHKVDVTAYIDSVVFDTGLTGLTNGVAWDSSSGKLYYRNPESGSLYYWNAANNVQHIIYGAVLPGVSSDAAVYNGYYWYVAHNTDTLVRATLDFNTPNIPVVVSTTSFANFDGTAFNSFSFGDITIDKNGVLYGSSNYGLFSVNVSGGTPSQFQILSAGYGVRQIALDTTESFLYAHDHSTGKWYSASFTGVETPVNSGPNTQFSSAALTDIGAFIASAEITESIPEPAAWQLLLAGIGCLSLKRLRAA